MDQNENDMARYGIKDNWQCDCVLIKMKVIWSVGISKKKKRKVICFFHFVWQIKPIRGSKYTKYLMHVFFLSYAYDTCFLLLTCRTIFIIDRENIHPIHGIFSHTMKAEKWIFYPFEKSRRIKDNKVKPLVFN